MQGKSAAAAASHVVVIGFSAAGLEPLRTALRDFTPAFSASIVIVHHAREQTELPAILKHHLHLNVRMASIGDVLCSGTVFVCPSGQDIFVNPDRTVGLSVARPARWRRPADRLFESAAAVFGPCAVGVVLSGRLSDGARGVPWIKRSGGRLIVQTPSTCGYASMPSAAIATGCVDLVLDPEAIGPALRGIVSEIDGAALLQEWESPFESAM